MSMVQGFEPFSGQHCETSTTGNLLKAVGMELSEAMLYGLGEGLAFGVFAFKGMAAPFLGGRPRPEQITQTLARNLGFDLTYRQTRSRKRAWDNVADFVDAGRLVGAKLNMRLLDYDRSGADFAAHYVAVCGYDDEQVFVVDTFGQGGGPQATSRASFEAARLWRGPMASNALTWTIDATPDDIDLPRVLRAAIRANSEAYLNPPIANFGARGIRKAAMLLPGWSDTYAPADLSQVGMLMERGGTGGGLFRRMYGDFLREAALLLTDERLLFVAERFDAAGLLWTQVSALLESIPDEGAAPLPAASRLLAQVADIEEDAVRELSRLADSPAGG